MWEKRRSGEVSPAKEKSRPCGRLNVDGDGNEIINQTANSFKAVVFRAVAV